jgi:hypothetical protein
MNMYRRIVDQLLAFRPAEVSMARLAGVEVKRNRVALAVSFDMEWIPASDRRRAKEFSLDGVHPGLPQDDIEDSGFNSGKVRANMHRNRLY